MRALFLVVPLMLASCAPQNPVAIQSSLPAMLAGLTAGAPRNCIPTRMLSGLQLVDDNTVTMRDGGKLWVNRLPAPCDTGNGFKTIVVDLHGEQYCRNDFFRLVEPGSSIPGPACFLGQWVSYTRG